VIDTDKALHKWLPRLKGAEWVALDTEADSLHAYPEKLCLLQVSTAEGHDLIDPLSDALELAPLWNELRGRELILHGADYDLRLLRKNFDYAPCSIFDTMIAARLIGCEKFGLANLVEQFLDVALEKGPQKANWARRPLTERMEEYARNDTRYLKPLSDLLRAELQAKGRLDWHKESCDRLLRDCSQPAIADPDTEWRIKGSAKLSRRGLALLREVWRWRESEARAANRPLFHIMNPKSMLALCDAAAEGGSTKEFISPRFSTRRRKALDAAIEKGAGLPEERLPRHIRTKGKRMTASQKQKVVELQAVRDKHAEALKMDPTLIASRATLTALAVNWDQALGEMMGWQRQFFVS